MEFDRLLRKKSFRGNLPSRHSPDSSGSPLLCVGIGDAAATADSGTHHDTSGNRRLLKIFLLELLEEIQGWLHLRIPVVEIVNAGFGQVQDEGQFRVAFLQPFVEGDGLLRWHHGVVYAMAEIHGDLKGGGIVHRVVGGFPELFVVLIRAVKSAHHVVVGGLALVEIARQGSASLEKIVGSECRHHHSPTPGGKPDE